MAELDELRAVPAFRDLPAPTLAAVGRALRTERPAVGTVVVRHGEPGAAVYLVRRGGLDFVVDGPEDEGPHHVAAIGPGGMVADATLLLAGDPGARLIAGADTELWVLDRGDLDELAAEWPAVARELGRAMSRRLAVATRRLSSIAASRMVALWGEGVGALASAVHELGAGPVAVEVLPGAVAPPELPPGVRLVGPNRRWVAAGRFRRPALLITVLPGAPDAAARAAVSAADHVIAVGDAPQWIVDLAPRYRLLRARDAHAVAGLARWATGRAVGLALSSGGSKTAAHLGVVRTLRAAGIAIDAVAGSSGGALVGAGVAFDLSTPDMLDRLHELAGQLAWRRLDVNVVPRSALLKGRRLHDLFAQWYEGSFADARLPLWVVAADLDTGAEVVLHEGPVADALRASLSIPGVFDPWPVGDRLLIDGAVVTPLPAGVLRQAGVGVVLASNVAGQQRRRAPDGARGPRLLTVVGAMVNTMERELVKTQAPLADVVVRPVVHADHSLDFSHADAHVDAGAQAAEDAMPAIRRALEAAAEPRT
jgi:NTE family protein